MLEDGGRDRWPTRWFTREASLRKAAIWGKSWMRQGQRTIIPISHGERDHAYLHERTEGRNPIKARLVPSPDCRESPMICMSMAFKWALGCYIRDDHKRKPEAFLFQKLGQ